MIKSMTGFGRSEYSDGKRTISVEIRSVNHRYNEISVRMPRRYSFAEEKVKATVKKIVTRGKVDLSINVEALTEDDLTIKLNPLVAGQYIDNLQKLQEKFDLEGRLDLQFVSALPDVMKSVPDVEDQEEFLKTLDIAVGQAAGHLDSMRTTEGKKLTEDLIKRSGLIKGLVHSVEERAPDMAKIYAEKLSERIKELIGNNVEVPEDRILLEAAIFADKSNITEELVRLDSHMGQLEHILQEGNPTVGKKLDFLVQEMNREANTIGSKAGDIQITNLVLEIKSEIEKIREQIQNIQ